MHYISVSYFRREGGGAEIEKDQWLWWLYPLSALDGTKTTATLFVEAEQAQRAEGQASFVFYP